MPIALRLGSRDMSPLFHLSLRLATLALRFALTFHVVRTLGYEASGIYGLTLGAVGIAPAAIGWGLNYFCARDVVNARALDAASILKARLLVTALSLAICLPVALVVIHALGLPWSGLVLLIALLIVFETVGLDIHMPLLALNKGREANLLVFIRSALWVPLLIGGGMLFPALNSLTALFLFWIAAHLVALCTLLAMIPRAVLRQALYAPVGTDWIAERLRHSWIIYVSDVSLVGMLFADRYVVTMLLGIDVAGLYTFYWSLTNALQTLVSTAIVQVLFPSIYRSFEGGNAAALAAGLRHHVMRVGAIVSGMGVALFFCGEVASLFLPEHDMTGTRGVFVFLILAAVVRTLSEVLNLGLTTMRKDNHYAGLNVAGVVLSLTLGYGLTALLGFVGIGIAALATASILCAARLAYLVGFLREAREKHGHGVEARAEPAGLL